jgi:hypothetical protein
VSLITRWGSTRLAYAIHRELERKQRVMEDHRCCVPHDQSSEYFRKLEGGSFSDLQTFGYSRRHGFSPNGAGGAAILFGSPASGEMVSGQRVNEC